MSEDNKLPDELKKALATIVEHFDIEDRAVRERQLRLWKRLKYYWAGFSRVWWSDVAHDWRVYDLQQAQSMNDSSYYDKPINVLKPYLESLIAALSVTVPPVKCFPDDTDNPDDLITAKGGDKIAELVYRHNDVPLLWIHALFLHYTEGMIACYSRPEESEKYGTYDVPKYEDTEESRDIQACPTCGNELQPQDIQLIGDELDEKDEFDPDADDDQSELLHCSQCQTNVEPQTRTEKFTVKRLVGITQEPKSRVCLDVLGGLNVKIPNYARNQSECPYLIYSYEKHYSFAIDKYEFLADLHTEGTNAGGIYDHYERWARLSTEYLGDYPNNVGTFRECWLRPNTYHILNDKEITKRLKKRFPNGVKVIYYNDQYCESQAESLDDHWTLAYNPLYDYVHHDPVALVLTAIQDITNDLIALTVQTIEHGVSITFADKEVLDFDKFRKAEVAPGQVFPAKPKTGKAISDSFYELRTAALSPEVGPFGEKIQQLGQFSSGAIPSIFGGAPEAGNKTAASYAMSRAQGLQRLQTPWKSLTFWWKNIFGKVIPMVIKEMKDDEHFTKTNALGNFVTVMIKKAEMTGKIGSVELEAAENLPITWLQKKDVIMQLMQSPNPEIMQALMAPENSPLLAQAIGLDDFELPDEQDRIKQYEEITELINNEPIMGVNGEMPSIDIDTIIDNHVVEAAVLKRWLVSEAGRQAKIDKPKGYRNCLLHLQHHMMAEQNAMMQQQQQQQPPKGKAPAAKPPMDQPTENDPQNGAPKQ